MDATFWVGAAFVIFIGILVYLKVPGMVIKALDERAKKISDDLDEARELREEAQVLLATYQRRQRDALKEAEEIVEHAKEAAAREAEQTEKKLEESLARRQQAALNKIALAEARAEKEVRDTAIDIAITAATAVVAQQVQGDHSDKLVDAAVQNLNKNLN